MIKNNLMKVSSRVATSLAILFFIRYPVLLEAQNKDKLFLFQHTKKMSERWELTPEDRNGLFVITPYRPVYVTAGRFSDNPNQQPVSENPAYSLLFKVPLHKVRLSVFVLRSNGCIFVFLYEQYTDQSVK
ncbi:MAG: hypothetical protein ABIQ31_01190 [Ferruginibacter sp.]